VAAALAMALAVSSMHYTGMAAIRVAPSDVVRSLPGVSPVSLLVPISLLACLLLVGLFYALAGMSINAESDLGRSRLPLTPPSPSPHGYAVPPSVGLADRYRGSHSAPG
jgi:hypothetical protein